jgi:hypothetical protein
MTILYVVGPAWVPLRSAHLRAYTTLEAAAAECELHHADGYCVRMVEVFN